MIDQFDRSDHDLDDLAKWSMAEGHNLIRAIADQLSRITYRGEPISPDQLNDLHARLDELWLTLYRVTLDIEGVELEDARYSDGSPVVVAVESFDAEHVPPEFYSGDIPGEPGWQLLVSRAPADRGNAA
jgi:hypothetical protein